jgi:hypothetical protein
MGGAMNVCAALALSVAGLAKVTGQAAPQGGTQAAPSPADGVVLSEQYFKNIQALRGIPVDEFMDTMGMFAAATGMNCVDCHVSDAGGDWAKYADDTAFKRTTRRMVAMVNTPTWLLRRTRAGHLLHVPSHASSRHFAQLDLQYGDPPPVDPDQITRATPGPGVDRFWTRICRLSGARRVAESPALPEKGPTAYDDFSCLRSTSRKSPDQRTTIQHWMRGHPPADRKNAWMAAPDVRPFPVVPSDGGSLDGARRCHPGIPRTHQTGARNWRRPGLGGRSGCTKSFRPPRQWCRWLYFDTKTGLLLRSVRIRIRRWEECRCASLLGHRAVSGVKIPFKRVTTWTDGRTVFQLDSAQANTAVEASRFAKPKPPAPPKP